MTTQPVYRKKDSVPAACINNRSSNCLVRAKKFHLFLITDSQDRWTFNGSRCFARGSILPYILWVWQGRSLRIARVCKSEFLGCLLSPGSSTACGATSCRTRSRNVSHLFGSRGSNLLPTICWFRRFSKIPQRRKIDHFHGERVLGKRSYIYEDL